MRDKLALKQLGVVKRSQEDRRKVVDVRLELQAEQAAHAAIRKAAKPKEGSGMPNLGFSKADWNKLQTFGVTFGQSAKEAASKSFDKSAREAKGNAIVKQLRQEAQPLIAAGENQEVAYRKVAQAMRNRREASEGLEKHLNAQRGSNCPGDHFKGGGL